MALEQGLHWLIWTSSIAIALLSFIKSCDNHPARNPEDFTEGWKILNGRLKDNSDLEWTVLTMVFKKYWTLLVFQVICSQVILRIKRDVFPMYLACYSLSCLMLIVGVKISMVYLLYIVIMYSIHTLGSKTLCYVLTMCALLFLHNPTFYNITEVLSLEETESFLFDTGLGWLMAKGLSFSIDRIKTGRYTRSTLLDITSVIAYSLYLPAVFTGPIISYQEFSDQMLKTFLPSLKELTWHAIQLLYRILWFFVYEFFLHYIFSSAVQFSPEVAHSYNSWSLCGLGYALPMMFFTKYFIIYGIAGSFARLECFSLPPPPKCISSVHLSSFLWRYFDRGLYLWILRYLYRPLINGQWNIFRKIFALSICFAFVSLWHGMDESVCVWSALNCLLVTSEMAVKCLLTTGIGKSIMECSSVKLKRVSAAISTFHFLMMCISCTFFLSNWDIGMLMVRRILFGGMIPLAPLAIVMYCGCHVSMDSKHWQVKKPTPRFILRDHNL